MRIRIEFLADIGRIPQSSAFPNIYINKRDVIRINFSTIFVRKKQITTEFFKNFDQK